MLLHQRSFRTCYENLKKPMLLLGLSSWLAVGEPCQLKCETATVGTQSLAHRRAYVCVCVCVTCQAPLNFSRLCSKKLPS